MPEQTEKPNYKKTLNLPKTPFAMKANLVQNEPASVKRWEQDGLYAKLQETRKGGRPCFFHDGPPYANGSIHLGHLLNKVLKDFVVRSRSMMGDDVPYVPGWDCHGLPIEHKVMQELGDAAKDMEPLQIRRKCRSYAEKFVKLQAKQMQRLLTLADYDDPYLTMAPGYEASVLEVFATLVERGLVYRGLKPVHWSIENRTALAEAELEYYDRTDTSVYVFFELEGADGEALMIWTTTPWTLPANLAVAVSPRAEYGRYDVNGRKVWLACDLAADVLAKEGVTVGEPEAVKRGEELVGWTYRHPFIDRVGRVVAAEYVTLEDGTGLVHTAPGHGTEDYQTGLREGLDIYCPVQADGTFDDTAPDWLQGKSVWDANPLVCDRLTQTGHMFHQHDFEHSYPHDWRGKSPVIFRATEQWFVAVDKPFSHEAQRSAGSLRDRAMACVDDVTFYPAWGRNRLRGMLETRPDWCLSRQRAWGLPIPAFYKEGEAEPLLTPASVRAVGKVFAEKGSDAWFVAPVEDLLAHYDPAADPDAPSWATSEITDPKSEIKKSSDIFDVWFESGSSWHAVMQARFGEQAVPTDLYLEGSDQHRGWFQQSLLPCLGVTGRPPFKAILTHGFMVDKDGKKMSKSLGNTLEVEELMKTYGADVCRWWVSSLNTDNDIKVDESYFKVAGEEYRKIRNTIRFLLSNLGDFQPNKDHVAVEPESLDAWALDALDTLVATCREAYDRYAYRRVHEAIFNFCNDTMSAVYLAATKDRLYCDAPDSPRRRRTQTVIHRITSAVLRLLAPICPHTADEAWQTLIDDKNACVHLENLPEPGPSQAAPWWGEVMEQREGWLRAIEQYRQANDIDNPLDLGLRGGVPAGAGAVDPVDLADLCMVSRFEVTGSAGDGPVEVIDLRDEPRCERSWKRDGTVKPRSDGGVLSDRDAAALGV